MINYLNLIAQKIYDKKGFNILALDVRGVSPLTDYFLIAEGSVNRHVQALSKEVLEVVSTFGLSVYHVEGEKSGDWIVIDCGDLLVHLFLSDLRKKYALEELWKKGEIIDLNIKLEKEGKQ